MFERLKLAWHVLRNGPGSITFVCKPNVFYEMPDLDLHGPLSVYIKDGTMRGTILPFDGPAPIAVTKYGSFEMADGPYVIEG